MSNKAGMIYSFILSLNYFIFFIVKIFLIHEKKEYLLNQEIFANSTYIDDLISQYPNQNVFF